MMEEEIATESKRPSEPHATIPEDHSPLRSVDIHTPPLEPSPGAAAQGVADVSLEPMSPATLARDLSGTDTNAEAEDESGLATVQSGLWGLWGAVTNVGVVRAAVNTAREVRDRAVHHVQERGLVQTALDGAQAAVESAKRMDDQLLHGVVSRAVTGTITAAHKGVEKVREHLPLDGEEHAQQQGPGFVITSTAFEKVNALRVALQGRHGDVSLRALSTVSGVAPQPVGWAAGMQGAAQRIESLRSQNGIREGEVIVSIENFIVEVVPGLWQDVAAVILRDDAHDITVRTVSQGVTVDPTLVAKAQVATPSAYEHRQTGFAVTIGELMHQANNAVSASDWHSSVCGVSRQSQLHVACVVALGEHTARLRALPTLPPSSSTPLSAPSSSSLPPTSSSSSSLPPLSSSSSTTTTTTATTASTSTLPPSSSSLPPSSLPSTSDTSTDS